jgi:hypothetical protein
MRSRIIRALAIAMVIGTLLLAGTAPLGSPGTDQVTVIVGQ